MREMQHSGVEKLPMNLSDLLKATASWGRLRLYRTAGCGNMYNNHEYCTKRILRDHFIGCT